jgi:2-(1,2-epoxy-1,2-dihydrophenyl)acetyl-CoA isomerase
MESSILESRAGGVLTLTLNRPERRNALDEATITALHARLVEAGEDRSVRVVVLAGAGGAFSAGADVREAASAPPEGDLIERAFHPAIRAVRRMPKPVIAAVDGIAAGYGASLALAADIRLASTRAAFAFLFARIGLTLDGGASWLLPRLVGLRAAELAMTGDVVPADEAYRLGLVNHVYPEAGFADEVTTLARRLAAGAPLALAAVKATIAASLGPGLDAALEDERIAQRRLITSADFAEGVAAFLGKRGADFKGE